MKSRNTSLTLTMALAILLTMRAAPPAAAGEPSAGDRPAVGDKAKDFALETLDGKTVRLSESLHKGPLVLVVLRGWVGYQCPVCTRQVGDLMAHAKQFDDAGARVVLVYPGPADGLKEHAEDFISGKGLPTNFSFVLDPHIQFVSDWGLRWNAPHETAYPSTFVIDTNGVVRFVKVSTSHGGRASANEILAALAALAK